MSEQGLDMLQASCNVPSELMKHLVKAKNREGPTKEKYPLPLRTFVLTLNSYSAKAYRFVHKTFNFQLPHPSVIPKWYSTIDGQPRFTAEAFSGLEAEAKIAKEKGHELVCCLLLDEMTIKTQVQWDGKKFHGYIAVCTECNDDSNSIVTQALVFMVVLLNAGWKIPVGYFFINGLTGQKRAHLVQQCKLSDIGVWIESVTCDRSSCHFRMLETLGVKMTVPQLTPSFLHPHDANHRVHVLMRNTLASYGIIKMRRLSRS